MKKLCVIFITSIFMVGCTNSVRKTVDTKIWSVSGIGFKKTGYLQLIGINISI